MPAFWNPNSLHYVIDWSAWATFVVGIAAVIGAFIIGLRQVGIAARQAETMERQTLIADKIANIERIKLRTELYDRRVMIFTTIDNYIDISSDNDGIVSKQLKTDLYRAISLAPYVLGNDIAEIGKKVARLAQTLQYNSIKLNDAKDEQYRAEIIESIITTKDDMYHLRNLLRSTIDTYINITNIASEI